MDTKKLSSSLAASKIIMDKTANYPRNQGLGQPVYNIPQPQQQLTEGYYNNSGGLFDDMSMIAGMGNGGYSQEEYQQTAYVQSAVPRGKKNIKNALLKEIANNPIGTDDFQLGDGSVLDSIDLGSALSKSAKQMPSVTNGNLIRESSTVPQPNYVPNYQTTVPRSNYVPNYQVPQQSPIDYSMIRMIIEDVVEKKFNSLNNNLINESVNGNSNNLSVMKIGKGFSFVDKDGNVYKAELKFVKNINNKK